MQQKYQVYLEGVCEGNDVTIVKQRVAQLFRVEVSRIEPFFSDSSKPILVKADHEKASRYESALRRAGAKCVIKPSDSRHDITSDREDVSASSVSNSEDRAPDADEDPEAFAQQVEDLREKIASILDTLKNSNAYDRLKSIENIKGVTSVVLIAASFFLGSKTSWYFGVAFFVFSAVISAFFVNFFANKNKHSRELASMFADSLCRCLSCTEPLCLAVIMKTFNSKDMSPDFRKEIERNLANRITGHHERRRFFSLLEKYKSRIDDLQKKKLEKGNTRNKETREQFAIRQERMNAMAAERRAETDVRQKETTKEVFREFKEIDADACMPTNTYIVLSKFAILENMTVLRSDLRSSVVDVRCFVSVSRNNVLIVPAMKSRRYSRQILQYQASAIKSIKIKQGSIVQMLYGRDANPDPSGMHVEIDFREPQFIFLAATDSIYFRINKQDYALMKKYWEAFSRRINIG